MDTIVVVRGDTAINVNSNNFKNANNHYLRHLHDGLYYGEGSKRLTEDKDLFVKMILNYKDSLLNGVTLAYTTNDDILGLFYSKNNFQEGIQIDFMSDKGTMVFTVYDNNKYTTAFWVNKNFKILKRVYFNNEIPYRIVFFDKKNKIKGDFAITELEKKVNWADFKYWKRKMKAKGTF